MSDGDSPYSEIPPAPNDAGGDSTPPAVDFFRRRHVDFGTVVSASCPDSRPSLHPVFR
ncbi:hypothetical protein [Frankia sp. QA3]|uniref:hypothetical protein n=1 Tax=Frankia sp. QA3 TaxID=710111 RepID=UPI000269CA6F|nr:hypothetical protein [Frankia sp. QA3]EIV94900.1 hypothetical protein FraQA3DRAFT_4688 [Frankia sp. QA3]